MSTDQATGQEALAPAAVAVIVAYCVLSAGKDLSTTAGGEAAGVTAADRAGLAPATAVHDLVARRLAEDELRAAALLALREQPTSESHRRTLAAAVAGEIAADAGFGQELRGLVERALASTAVQQTILTVYGYEQATAIERAVGAPVSRKPPTAAQNASGSSTNG